MYSAKTWQILRFKLRQKLILLVTIISIPFLSYSQELKFEHLSVEQGLSQSSVWKVHQDKLGFIWVVSQEGLNLYNGYTFTVFRNNPEDTTSISNNIIQCIAEEPDGTIWVGTKSGLNRFNRNLNNFDHFFNDPNNKASISNNNIGALFVDSYNNVWIGTDDGLNLYQRETKTFKHFFNDPNDPHSITKGFIGTIAEDSARRLWFPIMGGLSRYDHDTKKFTNYYHSPENTNTISSNKITSVFPDGKYLWIGTFDTGLDLMNLEDGTVKHYRHNPTDPTSLANDYVYNINQNKDGELYVCTDKGLNLMNKKKGTFTRYVHSENDKSSISSDIVTGVMFDKNDRMWVSTRFGGVNVYDKGKNKFHRNGGSGALKDKNVTSFTEDEKGNLWIGTDGNGLFYYDRKSDTYVNYLNNPSNKNSLTNNKVLAVKLDHLGNLWIGFWGGGIDVYNRNTKSFKHYTSSVDDVHSLSDNNIFYIFEDSKGNIWIGTWGNGMSKYNRDTDNFTRYTHDPNNPKSIEGSTIALIAEDHLGNIWLATESQGLEMFDPKTQIFTHFKGDGKKGSLSGNSIFCVFEDSKKRIWVGTNGAGLNLYDRKTGKFSVYRKSNGLPNETVVGILEDKSGNLWLSTNNGLCRFNPEEVTFKPYDVKDGLNNTQFSLWSFLALSTNELVFGGTNGYDLFNPEEVKDNDYLPPVFVTDFKLFNKPVKVGPGELLEKNIVSTDEINLNYNQNFFSFEFAALNYRQPEKNQYKYILEGVDQEWIDAGTERKVSYTNLNPGQYVFKVIASNNDGAWNTKPTLIKINITPPFWDTWWFKVLCVVVFATSIFSFYKIRMNAIKAQKEELEKQVKERTQEVVKQKEELQEKHEEVLQQTEEILQQRELLEEQRDKLEITNEKVMSSIRYAKTIQKAILPSPTRIDKVLPEHFVLYRPKDIVSGDFYWFTHIAKDEFNGSYHSDVTFVASIDCTGHGVPGAFMSIIGNTLLNEIINLKHILDPAEILELLDKGVKKAVESSEGVNTAGMDVCLVRLEKGEENQVRVLYGGAKRPLYYVKKGSTTIDVLEGDRRSIGSDGTITKPFKTQEIIVEAGTTFYLTSDGYTDQNNEARAKLGTPKLRELIIKAVNLPLSAQKDIFEKALDEHQKEAEQRDDITLVGVKV